MEQQLSVWVGAGLVTAGVSAALIAGTGVAGADSGSDSGSSASSGSSDSGTGTSGSAGDKSEKNGGPAKASPAADKPDPEADAGDDDKPATDTPSTSTSGIDTDKPGADEVSDREATSGPTKKTKKKPSAAAEPAASDAPPAAEVADTTETAAQTVSSPTATQPLTTSTTTESVVESAVESVSNHVAAQAVSARSAPTTSLAQAQVSPNVTPEVPSALDVIGGLIGAVVVNVGSFAFNALQAVEALVTGPPVVPPNSTVTVRSSTIQLSNGQRVAANWFYPEGDEPPTQMILLQHGFLALGPMYSYTAANLAEQTHSIVVTPTLSSNPFAGDSFWLGGTGMSAAIADLFVGDRAALTESALDAGYATRYGLDPDAAQLPQQFALAGHSLGANLVSGAAGFLAENDAADDLVGVILLDGVPIGDTLPNALANLDTYEATGGHYIPIREIGAPWNLFNSLSNVNDALSAARPDRFNGVVLAGGVHMDSMRGGNPLIQFTAYVVAGFPQPQNPPAVEELAIAWLTDWFNGDTGIGDDLVPGTTLLIPTPQGTAHGVVIGTAPAAALAKSLQGPVTLEPSAPSTIPAVKPRLASLAA
jgi:hypothetical protein